MLERFSKTVVCLDLETTRNGLIDRIGAWRPGDDMAFLRAGRFTLTEALAELDAFAGGARLVLGHNVLEHDLPALAQASPGLALLRLPVIDTLLLSPLAFPENPYHHLVKDYRLVKDSRNDPVADCRLAWRVFQDQHRAFEELGEPRLLRFYAHTFDQLGAPGLSGFFSDMANGPPLDAAAALEEFERQCRGRACAWATLQLRDELRAGTPPDLAYAVAWLRVAGGDSVLPPWVRLRFPDLPRLLDRLRSPVLGGACRQDCEYCRDGTGARHELRRIFGFDDFRPQPQTPGGESLQKVAVEHGLSSKPHLAVLATGAGKSLCYQLPALVHYFRRGLLTLVISPLQALMKDQVENLNARTGSEHAAALYGLLSPPERGQVLERVRLGAIALLYVAPEQLRNRSFEKVIMHREIAGWVYDEAHCLSKWGHDFRPDYLYAARFIRRLAALQKRQPPAVSGYTATAKEEVIEEIRTHFQGELGQELAFFGSPTERQELTFLVEAVAPQEKIPRIAELLAEHLHLSGSAVIYFSSRRATENAANALRDASLPVSAFHAGLDAPTKRQVLDGFASGEIRIVCATNAFGMGIDKDDVRLVIHADIPGSLENYIQEAGRAGRDRRRSLCVLFYDEQDVERQFKMVAGSRLSQRDVAQLLGGIRRASRKGRRAGQEPPHVVLTSGELVRDEEVDIALKPDDWGVETRVRAAIAWLERAGFLRRLHNRTRVFEGRLQIDDLDQARRLIDGLAPGQRPEGAERRRWLAMIRALINADPSRGLTADELAELPDMAWSDEERAKAGQHVLRGLSAMADAGLLKAGLQLAAYVRPKGKNKAGDRLAGLVKLERAIFDELQEADPDAELGEWRELSLRLLNQKLLDRGLESQPRTLRRLLRSLMEDGKGLAGRHGSLEIRYRSRDRYGLCLLRDWGKLRELADRRQQVASVVLETFISRADPKATGLLLVELAMEDLVAALRADLVLRQRLHDPLAAAERGLLFLHEQGVIQLQNGLAVFRQAMTLELLDEKRGRRYGRSDYQPLEVHYGEKTFQIHAMARYAELGLEKLQDALHLVRDYFAARRERFTETWFPEGAEQTSRATGPESYRRIVTDLANRHQEALVTAPTERNLLVLAGPGSGKTRVVVHRCAYLLRVRRVPPRAMLVLCFNRNASLELRRRLRALVGDDAAGVTVCTYHGLAMRLLGRSFATEKSLDEKDLAQVIPDAVALLRRDAEASGDGATEEGASELIAGYSHILVDEYQDIDQDQYELVAEVAGQRREEGKLAILAVGDDDQTIYGWSGARIEFIRKFRQDYGAEEHSLVQCYRSSRHILDAAYEVIRHLPDRLKQAQAIEVDEARREDPPGGSWAGVDTEGAGRVRWIEPRIALDQARQILGWLQGLRRLDPELEWQECAVLARRRDVLMPIRAALEAAGIAVAWAADRDRLPPLHRIRELRRALDALLALGHRPVRASELLEDLDKKGGDGPWFQLLRSCLEDFLEESADRRAEARAVAEFLYESLAERRSSPAVGGGVLLSTVHGAKGLEFDHVAVADGGWDYVRRELDAEEQRRLYYVAMTRARQTLLLSSIAGGLPFERSFSEKSPSGLDLDRRPLEAAFEAPRLDDCRLNRRFEIMGLEDFYLSYAGSASPAAPIHRHLAQLRWGDDVRFEAMGEKIEVRDRHGHRIARLSGKGAERLRKASGHLESAKILAMVERRRKDNEPEYRDRLAVDRWEVPVLEIVRS